MIQTEGRLLHFISGSTGSRRTPHRDFRTAPSAVHQEGGQSPVHGAADQRQAECLSCQHQRTGDRANAPADTADGRAGGRHRTAQSTGSNAVGTTDEQHPGKDNENRESRSDLRIRYRAAGNNPHGPIVLRSNRHFL